MEAADLCAALGGHWTGSRGDAHCPLVENHRRGDRDKSLSVAVGSKRAIVVRCMAGCDQTLLLRYLKEHGLWPSDRTGLETRYPIIDADGVIVAEHVRLDFPDGSKKVWWERDGARGLGGLAVEALPLYNLPALMRAPWDAAVVVVEGEKACDALTGQGLLAVGTVTGAGGGKAPSREVLAVLLHFRPILWPDNDDQGREHMRLVAERLA